MAYTTVNTLYIYLYIEHTHMDMRYEVYSNRRKNISFCLMVASFFKNVSLIVSAKTPKEAAVKYELHKIKGN